MTTIGSALLNTILALLLAPLLEGVIRKLKAVIQSRKGPPIIQPYLDLLKLLGKENLSPDGGALFRLAPVACLGAILVAATLTPMGGTPPLRFAGDMIVWVYFVSFAAVAVILGAFASRNPYAYVGASREMMMVLSVEPVAIVALLVAAVKAKTLLMGGMIEWQLAHGASMSMAFAGVAFFLALQANVGKLPFDIPEAETEIMDGPFIEYSGPRLALFKMAFYARQLVFAFMLVSIFVPWPHIKILPLSLIISLAKVLVVYVLIGIIDTVNPRLRIDQSMGYFSRVVFVSLAALALAVIGV